MENLHTIEAVQIKDCPADSLLIVLLGDVDYYPTREDEESIAEELREIQAGQREKIQRTFSLRVRVVPEFYRKPRENLYLFSFYGGDPVIEKEGVSSVAEDVARLRELLQQALGIPGSILILHASLCFDVFPKSTTVVVGSGWAGLEL